MTAPGAAWPRRRRGGTMAAGRCPAGDAARRALAMPVLTTDALILRTYPLGEADRIVVFLTSERGKKRGVANGARSPRSRRFAGGLEPLTAARLAYFEREHRDLVRLRYVEPVRSPMLARDGERLGYVEYFAELLDECAPEAEPNAPLFRLGSAVGALLAGEIPVTRLARYFEYWVLRLQGVYPSLAACARCGRRPDRGGRIDAAGGGFRCPDCAGGRGLPLSAAAVRFLRDASATPPDALSRVGLPAPADQELDRAHRRLLAAHLEKEPRAARVLQAMLRTGPGVTS